MKNVSISFIVGACMVFLNQTDNGSQTNPDADPPANSPTHSEAQAEALSRFVERHVEQSRRDNQLAEQYGIVPQQGVKRRAGVSCGRVCLSHENGKLRLLNYDEKGQLQPPLVALSDGTDHAFVIPTQPGIWSVTKTQVAKFNGKMVPGIENWIIRARNGAVRVVDAENGGTVWVRRVPTKPGRRNK